MIEEIQPGDLFAIAVKQQIWFSIEGQAIKVIPDQILLLVRCDRLTQTKEHILTFLLDDLRLAKIYTSCLSVQYIDQLQFIKRIL